MKVLLVLSVLFFSGCVTKSDLKPYLKITQDISRVCLVRCKGAAVLGYKKAGNNLECICEESAKAKEKKKAKKAEAEKEVEVEAEVETQKDVEAEVDAH